MTVIEVRIHLMELKASGENIMRLSRKLQNPFNGIERV